MPLVSVYITLCDVVYTYAYYGVVFTIRCLLVSVYITLCDVVLHIKHMLVSDRRDKI